MVIQGTAAVKPKYIPDIFKHWQVQLYLIDFGKFY